MGSGKGKAIHYCVACEASVSVLFPSKDRAKNGASKRGVGGGRKEGNASRQTPGF